MNRTDTLSSLVSRALTRDPARPAIEFEQRWYSWGEIRQLAEQIGALVESSGAPPGAPVALIPRNRPSAVATLLGLIAKGCTVRMIYTFQSGQAIARDIARLKPAVVIAAAEELSEQVLATLRTDGIAGIAIGDMEAGAVPGLERVRRSDIEIPVAPRIEILTSGTTGPPKQFALSYELIVRHHIGSNLMHPDEEKDLLSLYPAILYFPLGNISGVYSTIPTMVRGRRAVLLDRFSVAAWRDYVLRYRPEGGGLPPAGIQMVLDADIPAEDLSSIRFVSTGAAPLDPTAHRAFEDRYNIPILLSYGATEFAGPVAAMTPELYSEWGRKKFGSVGRAMPGAQLRVLDPETGAVLPPGREGILEVVSPRIGPDWIRTSDVAVIDEDGFLFHRGRADGAIMRGGFKLLPETIERALMLHESVSAAGVTAVPDHRLGQVPGAAIQLKPDVAEPSIAELEAHLRQHVAATHIPVHWRFVESLPRNRSVKVDRPALRQLFNPAEPLQK